MALRPIELAELDQPKLHTAGFVLEKGFADPVNAAGDFIDGGIFDFWNV